MLIEKSPFYPNNNKTKEIDFEKKSHFEVKESDVKTDKETKNSFSLIKWIKGVVNPLQNLPLISGIYSSINSEDAESEELTEEELTFRFKQKEAWEKEINNVSALLEAGIPP